MTSPTRRWSRTRRDDVSSLYSVSRINECAKLNRSGRPGASSTSARAAPRDRVEQRSRQVLQRWSTPHRIHVRRRTRARHAVALGRQSRQPAPDDFLDAFGQSQLADVGARALAHLRENAGLGQVPERLSDKEGVAVGTLGDVRRQLARGIADERSDEPIHMLLVEPLQCQARDGLFPPQVGQHVAQRMRTSQLALTIRTDDADGRVIGGADNVPQHEQRGLVRPVQIVEHEQDGMPCRRRGKQRGHRFEESKAPASGSRSGTAGPAGGGRFGNERPEFGASTRLTANCPSARVRTDPRMPSQEVDER